MKGMTPLFPLDVIPIDLLTLNPARNSMGYVFGIPNDSIWPDHPQSNKTFTHIVKETRQRNPQTPTFFHGVLEPWKIAMAIKEFAGGS